MTNFSGLLQYTIVGTIQNALYDGDHQARVILTVDSKILSPLQMMLIQSALSETVYFQKKVWDFLFGVANSKHIALLANIASLLVEALR